MGAFSLLISALSKTHPVEMNLSSMKFLSQIVIDPSNAATRSELPMWNKPNRKDERVKVGEDASHLGPLVLEWWIHWAGVLFGCTSLPTLKPQAKPCRCSRWVASIIERIDLGCASNPMRVLIRLTAPWQGLSSGCSLKMDRTISISNHVRRFIYATKPLWAHRSG